MDNSINLSGLGNSLREVDRGKSSFPTLKNWGIKKMGNVGGKQVPDGKVGIRISARDNREWYEVHSVVSKTFGECDFTVTRTILEYLDRLDGENDGVIDIAEVEKFVNTIQNTGAKKDEFITYLSEAKTKIAEIHVSPDIYYRKSEVGKTGKDILEHSDPLLRDEKGNIIPDPDRVYVAEMYQRIINNYDKLIEQLRNN
ncbi:MAG: hypothetical protein LBL50_05485 [Candidatus Margulisbacteria bacterium]|nr:hypothetical protein [Candidatus Margulisiibacteriota bacterium]